VPVGSIEVSTKYSTYLLGDTVDFTVKNNFNTTVYIDNNCPSEPLEVYRMVGTTWTRIHDTASAKNCTTEDRKVPIPAKGTQTATFKNWPHLFDQPGKYRIVVYVQYFGQVPYRDFEIIARPPLPAIPALLPTPQPVAQTSQNTSSASANGNGSFGGANNTSTKTLPFRGGEGTATITYSSTAILSVVINSPLQYEMNNGTRTIQVTFIGGNQYDIRLRNGSISIQIAD
jgi:hypothetical protein